MSKKVHTSGGADIVIDSLVLRLQYDFTRRPNKLRNIDITTNEGLPYIACSVEDVNGRSNGNGVLNRSYAISNQPVTFTAIEQYGTYHFANWTDRSGKIVSEEPSLTVTRAKDQFYTANYERSLPILDVPDTIWVEYDEGTYSVDVRNIGSDGIEMDWYVSEPQNSWIHLYGETEGIDDGTFSFKYDANVSGKDRIDSLEIFAPETEIEYKKIYIAQVKELPISVVSPKVNNTMLRIFPNPARDFIMIEGEGLASATLYALTGRHVDSYSIKDKKYATLDISNLSCGMYIIAVETDNGVISKKILKIQ